MVYRYEELGDEEFQRLVAALVAHEGSRRVQAMPVGQKDGGRDVVDGETTVQAKYSKDGPRKKGPVAWLLAALDGERAKVEGLVRRGTRHYVLATNVAGTAALDVGTIDRIGPELRARQATLGLDSLVVWWRDDLDMRLAAAPTALKLAFQRVLLGDELLALTLLAADGSGGRADETLTAYVADRFEADSKVRFEQAGLNGPTVEKLFVDVPVLCTAPSSAAGKLLDRLGSALDDLAAGPSPIGASEVEADILDGPGESDAHAAGGARLLLHPAWTGNAVLVGGPGQGKTTLLQSVCQFHRARHLRDETYCAELKPSGPVSDLARVPVRLDLRKFAAWSAMGNRVRSLEEFVAADVAEHSGGRAFTVEDLARVVKERPVLLALDGLDEVASLDERERVAGAIRVTENRLRQNALDLVVLVATRPGSVSVGTLLGERFPALLLQRLTGALRLAYLNRWAAQAGLTDDDTARLRTTFVDNYRLPHVRELASNPMQLTILLDLLERRGLLPEQRTRLYDDYVKVFLDREAPKEPLVASRRDLVEDVHAFLAWHLQSTAESRGGSGAVALDDLRALLTDYLKDKGSDDRRVVELFQALTQRVICLVQREPGQFEFEVQPLREHFAARHIFENSPATGPGNSRDDCLLALVTRPYWSNVLRFLAGRLSKMELRALPSSLRAAGRTDPLDRLPLVRALAALLLDDQVFLAHDSGPVREMVDIALDGPGAVLAADGLLELPGGRFVLSQGTVREQVAAHCRERLLTQPDRPSREALAEVLLDHDDPSAVRAWWWTVDVPGNTWLATAADLRALDGMDATGAARVLAAAGPEGRTPPDGTDPLSVVLLRAASDTDDDRLLGRCLREFASGAGDLEPAAGRGGPLGRLHAATRPLDWAADCRANAGPGTARKRTRSRHGTPAVPALTAGRLEALRAEAQPTDGPGLRSALNRLDQLVGDTWLLRQAVLDAPAHLLPTAGTAPQPLHREPSVDGLTAWAATARAQRRDHTWWHGSRPGPDDVLGGLTWALALVTTAAAATVQACVAALEETVAALPGPALGSLLVATHVRGQQPSYRRLDLHDAVRLHAIEPVPATALLLYPFAFDATKERLAPLIAAGLPDLMPLGVHVAALALAAVRKTGNAPAAQSYRGSRRTVPLDVPATTTVTTDAMARKILNTPGDWPKDLVRLASDRLARLLARQPALAEVATANHWFPR